jgi:hypothetical protein
MSLRETWDKCALESRSRNLSADALLSLVVFSLNAVTDTSGRSSSLMVFGKVPRPLASIPSDGHEWEQLTTRDRHSLQTFAREAAELATTKTRLHEINRHARPTEVTPYVPGELCYAFTEKDGSATTHLGLPTLLSSSGVTGPHAGYCPETTAIIPSVSCQVRFSGRQTSAPGRN